MPHGTNRSFALILALAVPVLGFADGAVWRVTNGASTVYLGGTMHKLSPQQYPLPEEYQAAYERSDVLVFETDIGEMQSLAVQSRIAGLSRLPGGQTLETVLDPPTHALLEGYCTETGAPLALLEPLKPVPAMLTLLSFTLQSLGVTAPGVDEYFFQKAQSDSKDLRALETVDEQIAFLLEMDEDDPDQFVQRSIEDLREARRGALEQGMRAWRGGKEQELIERFLQNEMLVSPGLYQSLVVDRNRAWMRSIRQYIDTPETELVLVGVAHLVGDDGLVALLRKEGFQVERYSRQ